MINKRSECSVTSGKHSERRYEMKIYKVITKMTADCLKDVAFEVLEVSKAEKVDTETGEIKRYIKFEVEVPRNTVKYFSRCRLSVKVADAGDLPVTEEELAESLYFVQFRNLEISFISSTREVYFAAESFVCQKDAEIDDDSYN